jgi:methionyl-tRNA formyltransferase
MKKTSKTVVFFGNERLATGVSTTAPTLQALIKAGYHVAAVVANFERAVSRSARDLEIAAIAEQHGIPVLLPNKPADIADELRAFNADAAVLVAYGKIVPQSVIDRFSGGILNIHPSLLPLHRGPTPLESVILDGSTETGVSVMQLAAKMDAGPVFAQRTVPLTGKETKQELADRLISIGANMIIDVLPTVLDGSANPKPQHDAVATYDNLIDKTVGVIDWTKSAAQLERQIRAYAVWPKSHTQLAGKDVAITSAKIIKQSGAPGQISINGTSLIVHCGQDSLEITSLTPAGKKEMTAESFINGHKELLISD